MKKKSIWSKSLALILALAMALSCMSVTAFAAEPESSAEPETEQVQQAEAEAEVEAEEENTAEPEADAAESEVEAEPDAQVEPEADVPAVQDANAELPTMPEYGFVLNDITEKTVYQAGEGTVTITPADGTNPTTVELNNATLIGPGKNVQNKPTSGPVSKIPTVVTFDLSDHQTTKVILKGTNSIKDFYDVFSTYGNNASTTVEITGTGKLNVVDCTYFINSLGNVVFDGAKVDATVSTGAIVAGASNVSHSGIVIKNSSDLKFSVTESGAAPIGFMAGDVTISDSSVSVKTNGEVAIYNYFGYFSAQTGAAFNGTQITNSNVTLSASVGGYAGLFCLNSGDVVITDSELTVTQGRNGIRVDNGDLKICGSSTVFLAGVGDDLGFGAGARVTGGELNISGDSFVAMNAPKGVRVDRPVRIQDRAYLEITGEEATAYVENTSLDLTGYDSNGYYAVSNADETTIDGASNWDRTTTLDHYKFFKLTPAGTAAGWSGTYDGQPHSISVTVPTQATVEYSTDGTNYSTQNPSFTKVTDGAQKVYYRVLLCETVVDSGFETVEIQPKEITVSGITAADKTYDGTTNARVDASNAVLSGLVQGDDVSAVTSGFFDSKDAGDRNVVFGALVLSGADAENYTLSADSQKSASAKIMPREVTVSFASCGGVYGGQITPAQALLNNAAPGESPEVELFYTGKTNAGVDYASEVMPTEAGEYTVTAKVNDDMLPL